MFGDAWQNRADRLMGGDQFRQRRLQASAGVDVTQQLPIPLARTHIEIPGARGIAVFAATAASEPMVEVVVGQQDAGDPGEHVGMLLFGP
ncbi:hypothetical protein D3C84_793560 [compost metagenome]